MAAVLVVASYKLPCGIANTEHRIEQGLAVPFLLQLSSRRVHACNAKTRRQSSCKFGKMARYQPRAPDRTRQEPDGEWANGRNALDD
jgi:hypothetical protein